MARSAILATLYPPSREHPPRVLDEALASDGKVVACHADVTPGQTSLEVPSEVAES